MNFRTFIVLLKHHKLLFELNYFFVHTGIFGEVDILPIWRALFILDLQQFLLKVGNHLVEHFFYITTRVESIEHEYWLILQMFLTKQIQKLEFGADSIKKNIKAAIEHVFHLAVFGFDQQFDILVF